MEPGAPVPFTEAELDEFTAYVSRELDEAVEGPHSELETRLDEWDEAYAGEPKERRKTFPWPGAANIEIPIIAIASDSIVARIINTIYSVEPFWTVLPLRREVEMVAKPVQDYLDWSRKAEYDLYAAVRKNTNELVRHGWSWYKWGWEVRSQRYWSMKDDGFGDLLTEIVRRPVVHHILNRDMICQAGVEDDEQAEWIAHRFRITDNQLRARIFDDYYKDDDYEDIVKTKEDATRIHQALRSSPQTPDSPREKLNTMYELCIDWHWGTQKEQRQKPLVQMLATYHRPTKKFARIIFNPYGHRMYKKVKFIEREGRSEGFGIAKRLMPSQSEISTLHRQQIDNGTIANTKFFLGKRNVVRTNTPIHPGRVLGVNDVEKDLKLFDMGSPGALGFMQALERQALMYAERASGVSDYQLGRESSTVGSRATATGTLALIQEGNRRFDLNIRDLRMGLSHVGRAVLTLNQIFRPKGAAYFVQGEAGKWTEGALDLPREFTASKLSVELTASTATINREVEKQGLIALMGLTERYHQAMSQLAMVIANPQVPPQAKEYFVKAAQSATMLMRRVVQAFDQKSVNDLVPALIEPGGTNGPGAEEAAGFGGGPGSLEGSSPFPGMAPILGARGGPDNNGERRARGM